MGDRLDRECLSALEGPGAACDGVEPGACADEEEGWGGQGEGAGGGAGAKHDCGGRGVLIGWGGHPNKKPVSAHGHRGSHIVYGGREGDSCLCYGGSYSLSGGKGAPTCVSAERFAEAPAQTCVDRLDHATCHLDCRVRAARGASAGVACGGAPGWR